MGEPFEKVIVDCVGPLPKTKTQFLLTIMFASTRFPEAIPLLKITALQTDQGTNLKSRVFTQVLKTLGITHVTSSP